MPSKSASKPISGSRSPVDEICLSKNEMYWRDHQKWLRDCGYKLRPRYTPGWVPSWKTTKDSPLFCEDYYGLRNEHIIDAITIQDGTCVALKKISNSLHPHEVEIGNFFSSEPLASDPRNHCIPVLRVLHPPGDDDTVILVTPLMRRYDEPRFDTFGEAVEFFRQIFEGIQFMHENHVAHRDCNSNNIMMDGQRLYPLGFHPELTNHTPDLSKRAPHCTRTAVPVKYHIIDFGISCRYDPATGPPLDPPILGGDRSAPEFRVSIRPQNPFPTDVYYLGNMIRQEFLEGHPSVSWLQGRRGFKFMKPLVDDMVQDDPEKRPTMDEVVARFDLICKNLSAWKLRSRVAPRKDSVIVGCMHSARHWLRRIRFVLTRVPSIPRI